MAQRTPIQYDQTTISAGATNEYVRTDRVLPRRTQTITHLAAEDETTACTEIRVYVEGHGQPHLELEQDAPGAAELVWSDEQIILPEGCNLVARFVGTTSADRLRLYVEGYEELVSE